MPTVEVESQWWLQIQAQMAPMLRIDVKSSINIWKWVLYSQTGNYNILKSHMQGNLPKRKSPLLQLNLYNKMQCFPEHPEQQCTFLGKKWGSIFILSNNPIHSGSVAAHPASFKQGSILSMAKWYRHAVSQSHSGVVNMNDPGYLRWYMRLGL